MQPILYRPLSTVYLLSWLLSVCFFCSSWLPLPPVPGTTKSWGLYSICVHEPSTAAAVSPDAECGLPTHCHTTGQQATSRPFLYRLVSKTETFTFSWGMKSPLLDSGTSAFCVSFTQEGYSKIPILLL